MKCANCGNENPKTLWLDSDKEQINELLSADVFRVQNRIPSEFL